LQGVAQAESRALNPAFFVAAIIPANVEHG